MKTNDTTIAKHLEVGRPDDEQYQVVIQAISEAKRRLYKLELVRQYEETVIPGFAPKTLWEQTFGPKSSQNAKKVGVAFGTDLDRQIAATRAEVDLLGYELAEWQAREAAWVAANAQDPA